MVITIAANGAKSVKSSTEASPVAHASAFQQSYRELSTEHIVEVDVLDQLRSNLAQLEDLHGRLKHMMGELSYLLKRD